MPYIAQGPGSSIRYELASRLGHLPTTTNPQIRERLARYRKPEDSFDPALIAERVVPVDALEQSPTPRIRYVVAVDGSGHEYEEAFDRYPSTRVLYMQIAGVFIDLNDMLDQSDRFVDPARLADAMEASVVSGFLPGSYLEHEVYQDPTEAFRAELFYLFSSTEVQQRTLLQLLLEVQKHGQPADREAAARGEILLSKCPNRDCVLNRPNRGFGGIPVPAQEATFCPECSKSLWPTDILRIYEAFKPDAPNKEALGRCHQVIEHLILLGVALSFEQLSPRLLPQTAFLYDGDLAIFGEPAPLHTGLLGTWQALWSRCLSRGHQPPVVVGVAKRGYPVEHLRGIRRFIPRRHLMRLDDFYMRELLRVSSLTETYFGRKFFYHAADGQLLVLTVPPVNGEAYSKKDKNDLSELHRFPTLARTFEVCDRLGSRLYDDALIPVALAHNWAAYPLANAERVLRVLTEQTIKGKGNN